MLLCCRLIYIQQLRLQKLLRGLYGTTKAPCLHHMQMQDSVLLTKEQPCRLHQQKQPLYGKLCCEFVLRVGQREPWTRGAATAVFDSGTTTHVSAAAAPSWPW